MQRLDTHSTPERRIHDLRPLGLAGAVVLGRYHYSTAHPALPPHRHAGWLEICFLARGEQTYRVRGEDFHLHGGHVFLTFPGELHSTGSLPEERGDLYWLILDPRPSRAAFLGCDRGEARLFCQSLLTLHPRHFQGGPAMQGLLDELFAALDDESFAFRKTAVANSLVRFLLEVIGAARRARGGPSVSLAIATAQASIEQNLTERMSLETLATQAGMSLSRFKIRFRQEIGLPPAEFIMRRRIERAKGLLLAGNRSVTDVAFELGFATSQHFATVFRRFSGESPREFLAHPAPATASRPEQQPRPDRRRVGPTPICRRTVQAAEDGHSGVTLATERQLVQSGSPTGR